MAQNQKSLSVNVFSLSCHYITSSLFIKLHEGTLTKTIIIARIEIDKIWIKSCVIY